MKIIVCGDVKGKFAQLSKRLSSIIAKAGACEMAFCVGEFFGDKESYDELVGANIKFPMQTYVLGPCCDETASYIVNPAERANLCPNVTYLGKSGLFTTHSKLKIFYVSGTEGKENGPIHFDGRGVLDSVQSIASSASFKGVDILLTSQWPASVDKYANKLDQEYSGSKILSHTASLLKPRYHFCGLEDYNYERLPYRNHVVLAEKSMHPTRFIALATFANKKKQKFIYAFNIEPMETMLQSDLLTQATDTTETPYQGVNVEQGLEQSAEDKPQQFFYQERKVGKRGKGGDEGGAKKFKSTLNINPESCWFCLANPKVEKHMVVSIGSQCYLALAKGGLTNDHVLIIPINHHQSSIAIEQDIVQEIETYKKHLRDFFSKSDKVVVFFERNYKSVHLQLQAVPLPRSMLPSIQASIEQCGCQNSLNLVEIPERTQLDQIVTPPTSAFFVVELPDGKRLFTQVGRGFPLHFGRMMLCEEDLLNDAAKVDWKQCELGREMEALLCDQFRKDFQPFDPFD